MPRRTSRRTFLAGAGLLGMGFTAIRDSRRVFGAQANEKLAIGIIGAGGQGGSNTGSASREHIAAICDVDEERAGGAFQRFPAAKRFTDFRKMLDAVEGDLDAVVVSTPDHTHAVAAIAAMRCGLHVFCEKPLTRTVREARAMREAAAAAKVVTQMGNQGSASEGLRRAVEMAWGGAIGEIREAHVWFGGGNGPRDRPKDTPPLPAGFDWDLWLGPVTHRPFHPAYIRGAWRSWRAFGTGSFGDFGCHSTNIAFRALRLDLLWNGDAAAKRAPIRVEAEASEVHPEAYPRWTVARYAIPARGNLPPVTLTWHCGGPRPPAELMRGHAMSEHGSLLVGEKGALFSNCPWNTRFTLLPEKDFEGFAGPERSLPRGPGHHREWINACKGQGETFSPFAIGGPMTELILLGVAAVLAGRPIHYDPVAGVAVNDKEADSLLHREYREEWTL